MSIQLDPTIAKELEAGMNQGNGVEIPFPAPYLWVVNGSGTQRATGGALLFGGWATKADDMDSIAQQAGISIPTGFLKQTVGTKDNDEFDAYTTRFVMVAPLGIRQSWIVDGMHKPAYQDGARRHVQALVYMASRQGSNGGSVYMPWGPAVLTAKGFQARNLLDAFSSWNRYSQAARKKHAPGVPAWCFYVAIGTFGDKPVSKMVGKTNSQSPITPIGAFLPKDVGEKELNTTFVTPGIAKMMVEFRHQAAEWLNAWKEPSADATENDETKPPDGPDDPPEEELPF